MCHHRDDLKMVPGPIIFMSYLCYCSDCYASESPSSSAPPSLKGELIRKFLLNLSHLITIFCLPQCVSVKKSSSSQPMPKILLLLLCQSCPIFRVKFNNIKLHLWTQRGVWRTAKCRSELRESAPSYCCNNEGSPPRASTIIHFFRTCLSHLFFQFFHGLVCW